MAVIIDTDVTSFLIKGTFQNVANLTIISEE